MRVTYPILVRRRLGATFVACKRFAGPDFVGRYRLPPYH